MKQLFFFFGILLMIKTETVAQKIRFTDNSNVWQVYNPGGGTVWDAYANIILFSYSGDTIIGGISYKIMVDTFWRWSYASQGLPVHYSGPFSGWFGCFIREDTLANKVFIRMPASTNDDLLYDHNLNIGDTFQNDQATYKIASMDSVLINSIYHTRWHYTLISGSSSTFQYDVIEGIGSLETPQNPNTFENNWDLLCFTSANISQTSIPVISASGCRMDSLLSVDDLRSPVHKSISISPNPVILQSKISLPYKIIMGLLTIMDMYGKVIMTATFNRKEELQILNTFPPGLYVLQIKDIGNNRSFYCKFVAR